MSDVQTTDGGGLSSPNIRRSEPVVSLDSLGAVDMPPDFLLDSPPAVPDHAVPFHLRILLLSAVAVRADELCALLEPDGHRISRSASPDEALRVFRDQPFDLILIDLTFALDQIANFLLAARAIDPNLIAIAIAGSQTTGAVEAALDYGISDLISEPADKGMLRLALARARDLRQLRLQNLQLARAAVISELSNSIRTAVEVDSILHKFADAVTLHVATGGMCVLLPAANGSALRVAVSRGPLEAPQENSHIAFSRTIRQWVLRSLKRLARSTDPEDAHAPLPLALSRFPGGVPVPLVAGRSFVGIVIYIPLPLRPVSAADQKTLQTLCNAAAHALDSASLSAELESARQQYRRLSESAAEVVFRWELIPASRMSYINSAVTVLTGHKPEEFYDDAGLLLRIIHVDDRPLMETALKGEHTPGFPITLRCLNRNGTVTWIEQRNMPVWDTDGCLTAVECVLRDVTERKEIEDQLRQAQKMEAMGLLAGGVAHDFNNLLTVIIGYSDLILADDAPPVKVAAKVSQVKKAAEQAVALTRQLLAFGRRQPVQLRALNLNSLVEDNSKILRRIIGEDVELVLKLDRDLECIRGDSGQIEQILMNLCVNARGAMPHGGLITIETRNVTVEAAEAFGDALAGNPGAHVMLAVTDTGCGMNEATLSRIFEPFYTTKELGKGTGLGLSIVYGIVKQSAGHIRVFSQPGEGTRFEILIPRIEQPEERRDDSAALPLETSIGSETILVVEDDEAVRQLMAVILRIGGYEVLIASDASEALRICAEHKGNIALIVTDLIMPGMRGNALIEAIREQDPHVKALYMSAYSGESLSGRGQLDPGLPFIQKPFSPMNLILKIREVLSTPPVARGEES